MWLLVPLSVMSVVVFFTEVSSTYSTHRHPLRVLIFIFSSLRWRAYICLLHGHLSYVSFGIILFLCVIFNLTHLNLKTIRLHTKFGSQRKECFGLSFFSFSC